MRFGKELWKNGLFVSKTLRRILEGMLKSCPGLEQLKFSVRYIIHRPTAPVIRQNINPQ